MAEMAVEYVLMPADLARKLRACEGLQEWDMSLCERMDAEIEQVEVLNWNDACSKWHNKLHASGAGDGQVLMPRAEGTRHTNR